MKKLSNPFEGLGKPIKIDWHKMEKEREEREKQKEKEEQENIIKEKKRIEDIKCPVCSSIKKDHQIKYKSNGIIGPGYSSHVTEDYFVCLNCGVMYKDLKK